MDKIVSLKNTEVEIFKVMMLECGPLEVGVEWLGLSRAALMIGCTLIKDTQCYDLDMKCFPRAPVLGHFVPIQGCYLGKSLWDRGLAAPVGH